MKWSRVLVVGLALAMSAIAPAFSIVSASTLVTDQQTTDKLLDGTTDVDANGLADLARERATMGATWLSKVIRDTGAYFYIYDPAKDDYVKDQYNEVRHSGTTYAMYQAYGLTEDQSIFNAAEAAAKYIDTNSVPIENYGRAFRDAANNTTSIGGQALSIVALLERRRGTGDKTYDPLIQDLGAFLLALEMEKEPGRYYFSYDFATKVRLTTPDVVYYPGEALLALTRFSQQFPDGPYLAAAKRAAEYLVYKRDGDLTKLGKVPREDHWLAIALGELYRQNNDAGYAQVNHMIADLMISNQFTAADGSPQKIGGARRNGPISYTSTATKGEAIVAAWALANFIGDKDATAKYSLAANRNAQFQMRVQYTDVNTGLYPDPSRMVGGWPGSSVDHSIRIDYVQHNISVLIELWYLTKQGDIAIASAATRTADSSGILNRVRDFDPSLGAAAVIVVLAGSYGAFRVARRRQQPSSASRTKALRDPSIATAALPAGGNNLPIQNAIVKLSKPKVPAHLHRRRAKHH